ncbi:hypothetical protein C2S51_002746 [Perilla frutescens var. frutescens]|nr:hypothetical protein C2S51_002746 [Perilla frutescens var. frutescens]
MEWYVGSDDEDLAVPNDEEMFDRLPSPDSWPSWVNIVGNINSQKSEQMFSRHAFRHQSACAHERSDAQLNDLPKIEEADEIFFDSLFKVDAGDSEGSYSSDNTAQTSNRTDDVMAFDFSNHIRDCTNDALNVGHFSPEKELESEIYMFEERDDLCEDINEYMSMDEPVLLELQNLTQQLADTTRICFRDSLYRLAENSSYQTKSSRIGKEDPKNYKPITREPKTNESDTKAIDRTVATLLFTTMTFCDSTAAATSASSGLNEETLQREYQENSRVYHPGYFTPSLCIVEGGDAEVPTFDLMNQPLPQLSHTAF